MKILYGVQGTGNGHITRARALIKAMREAGLDVDILISGRQRAQLFGVDDFGAFEWRSGFSFVMDHGRIRPFKTLQQLDLKTFYNDVKQLDVSAYDLVLSDFEPVTAWAAHRQQKRAIGIGHQYAFRYRMPTKGINIPSRLVLRYFAPADIPVGIHWHHFGAPVLPPMIEPVHNASTIIANKVLVYLPFDELTEVINWLQPFAQHQFYVYCAIDTPRSHQHIHLRPFSRHGFKADLADCSTVITGAGFELPSEALVLGKRLAVRPLQAQFEQESNAYALSLMNRAIVLNTLSTAALTELFDQARPEPVIYPDVAFAFVDWLRDSSAENLQHLAREMWDKTHGLPKIAAENGVFWTPENSLV
jgi:uncharacterized protein (TIGR00661 family)